MAVFELDSVPDAAPRLVAALEINAALDGE